jgi:pyruvate,orthophosphate dikinase
MPSKALEVNIAYSRVDVTVDQRYEILQEVMGEYHGVRERLQTFLEEPTPKGLKQQDCI